ncbi:MAG: outer membrane beta-barrel domain-containing protein [Bdellovibrionota bacterium]
MKKLKNRFQIPVSRFLVGTLILAGVMGSFTANAQIEDPDIVELNDLENELDRAQPAKRQEVRTSNNKKDAPSSENIDFQGLGKLAPFTEVSVIQKKFMPKTERFQLSGGFALITNDPFFNSMGANLNLGYFFTESIGIEAKYFGLTNAERESTKELQTNNNVTTASIAMTKSYMGLDLVYVPVYGKMTWFNNRIIPFDLYIAAGGGTTEVEQNSLTTNEGTVHFAVGQIFALTKAFGFRWDFSWNFYNAKTISRNAGAPETSSFNNLFLTVGVSYFFPEAKYR